MNQDTFLAGQARRFKHERRGKLIERIVLALGWYAMTFVMGISSVGLIYAGTLTTVSQRIWWVDTTMVIAGLMMLAFMVYCLLRALDDTFYAADDHSRITGTR